MNFKIGDLVRFVDEPIEGHITSIQPNDIVGVTDDTGFEIPVPKSKITLVHGNMRMPEDDLDELPRFTNQPFVDKGIYLGIAGEQQGGLAKFYLINETSYELLVSISSLAGAKTIGLFVQSIPRNDFAQCYTANFSSIGQWPTFYIQIIRHCPTEQTLVQPLSKEIRIRFSDLGHAKERVEMLQEKVWLFELDKKEEDIGIDKLKSHFISHRPKRS
ncbi:hypothetical protein G5B35_17655 [Parapusillimonas sp. SGNA-6]|uniref:hypothetical protein n=1 Tax=Parapedobacter sp. SGR-10 TaxID=2710879 RepID=UPI0013D7C40E|nr:hypothetical protein [Parapedobacter sp. SGR-10]NGF56335.1 hypothetical protein [Parapedobacter sp. SGR-10]NGM89133.1 hypothetical protein [Parapusillimonas sp. SGNA-6]